MNIGLIGLGKMGGNMARRLARSGATVFGFDVSADTRTQLSAENTNIRTFDSVEALIAELPAPRVVWMMLPSGEISESMFTRLKGLLAAGDLVVDGANAMYKDSQRHATELNAAGFKFVDAGVSGGVWGLANGYTIMLGGDKDAVAQVEPFIKLLAPGPDLGWIHCGPAGSGHYTKMVHNGIEYGMMQAFAEGFALLEAKKDFDLDVAEIAETWRHGSVVRSWLLDLTAASLKEDSKLDGLQPYVTDSGEGRWTVLESVELGVPAPVIASALYARFASRGNDDYGMKLLQLMRNAFGGHAIAKK
ncbi:phosphogluconate dehydrogenase (NAD(+)-dependent, decarboxylating) [Jeongeupia naejangsanensis]|uniref:Decarboxylating 6-phosphogluconate dehydrogenase n=1 Tax=Jeongeupia naejangsanensis TaxID=613195 RepID=A0ABS2BJI9_9NEIS|nr:decarboxylating 6-phosphogluconate dehydrogenase [Jeongeupia naejangsanensis]MBM3115753.1 decarboxylating 6-phosphogluconate dehydrogenase [Jeongeupia naejangsanensis]